jgi:hypothetical protein
VTIGHNARSRAADQDQLGQHIGASGNPRNDLRRRAPGIYPTRALGIADRRHASPLSVIAI